MTGACARDALLQQELGRLDARVGVEPVDHHVAQQHVGDGDQRHPLVVRQVGLHDDAGAGAATAAELAVLVRLARRVVDGVVVAERPRRPRAARRRRLRAASAGSSSAASAVA